MTEYGIYVREYFYPQQGRERGEWHLFVVREEPSWQPYFTLCRNYIFDFKVEFGDEAPMSLTQKIHPASGS
jgi:hypothetical protein